MDRYVIRGGRAGSDRLQILGRSMAVHTAALLDHVGVAPGARCLDLGCGAGDVTLDLAGRVRPDGLVVAVDGDAEVIEVARHRAAEAGLGGIEFVVADLYTFDTPGGFDLVYSRNVIQHLSRPIEVLRTMWAAVSEGGVLVVEDADFGGCFCYPPNEGYDFWVERYHQVLRSYGGDPHSGRKLGTRFVEAGIPAPQLELVQRILLGEARALPLLTVAQTAEAMIDAGLATHDEIEAALKRLTDLVGDAATVVGAPRNFQAWVRRVPD